jgi:hypothetical protein
MRSSTFLAVLGAGLAIASPLIKKAIVTEIDTDVVYVYVTETAPTATTSSSVYTTVCSSMAGHQSLSHQTLSDVSSLPSTFILSVASKANCPQISLYYL